MNTTSSSDTATRRRLLSQARAAIAADWSCEAIPGDAEDSIESRTLLARLGIFSLQIWEPGPAGLAAMPTPRMSLAIGTGSSGLGGIMLHFESYPSVDAALHSAAARLREIAAQALAPLRV